MASRPVLGHLKANSVTFFGKIKCNRFCLKLNNNSERILHP